MVLMVSNRGIKNVFSFGTTNSARHWAGEQQNERNDIVHSISLIVLSPAPSVDDGQPLKVCRHILCINNRLCANG